MADQSPQLGEGAAAKSSSVGGAALGRGDSASSASPPLKLPPSAVRHDGEDQPDETGTPCSPAFEAAMTPLAGLLRAGAQLPTSQKFQQDAKKPRNVIAVSIFVALLARVAWLYLREARVAKQASELMEMLDLDVAHRQKQVDATRSSIGQSAIVSRQLLRELLQSTGGEDDDIESDKLRQLCSRVVDYTRPARRIQDLLASRGSVWFDILATLLVGAGLAHIVRGYAQLETRWAASSFRSAVQVSRVQNRCQKLHLQLGIFAHTRERLEETIAKVQAASAGEEREREAELAKLRSELESVQKKESEARREMEDEVKELQSKAKQCMMEASLAKNKMQRVMSCMKGIDGFSGAGKNKFVGQGAQRGFSEGGFSLDVITFGTIEDGELLMYETAKSRKIGDGKDGAYKCTDLSTGKEYALKMYSLQSQGAGAAILNDLRAHRSQVGKHPNVVNYLRVIESENMIFVIMELLKGKDLFEVVIEDGLTEETARPLFRELVLALAHLHDKNVIHCDVKPENAFVTGRPGEPDRGGARRDTFEPSSIPDCQLTLIDFGASCFPEADRSRDSGNIIYDVYMPPEHAETAYLRPTKATDLWRLGCTLFVMLMRGMPFQQYQRPVSTACIKARKDGLFYEGPPFGDLSTEARDLIRRLLAGEPSRRPSCEEVLQHPWLARK